MYKNVLNATFVSELEFFNNLLQNRYIYVLDYLQLLSTWELEDVNSQCKLNTGLTEAFSVLIVHNVTR